jgi:hypothetical protein
MKKTLIIYCSLVFILAFAGATFAVEPLKQDQSTIQNTKEDANASKSDKSIDTVVPSQKSKNAAKLNIQKGAQKVQAGDNIGTKGTDNMKQGMAGEQKGMGQ